MKPKEPPGQSRVLVCRAARRLFVGSMAVLLIALLMATALHIDGCSKQSPTVFDSDSSPVVVIDRSEDSASVNQDSVLVLQISTVRNALQGMTHQVAVTVNRAPFRFEGFDFFFGYDPGGIQFESASPGVLDTDCGWEYFDYRFLSSRLCDTCPRGMMQVVGIAELNNGDIHPDWDCFDSLGVEGPYTLFTLKFRLTYDRTFECSWNPIRFLWADCGDNTVTCTPDSNGLVLGASRYVFDDTTLTESLNNDTTGYPTITGFQAECPPTHGLINMPVVQVVDYINGGIHVVCGEWIDARGDVNLNGTTNEIADAVLFSNYFVRGIGVFNVNYQGQVAATDVNRNGVTLELGDLVYLIRHITGDVLPLDELKPTPASYTYDNGVVSVLPEAGAAFIVVDGDVVPRLLASEMEMSYAYDGVDTRILVWSVEPGARFVGAFLEVEGPIVETVFVGYSGAPLLLRDLPFENALTLDNYPNPFSDTTNISFTLQERGGFSCTVADAAGSRIIEFVGVGNAGRITFKWNASKQPEGIYTCRVEADGLVATHRMILVR